MRFANPSILWLLLLVPLIAWFLVWAIGRRKDLLARFATEKVLSRGEFLRNSIVVWARTGCLLLGLLFLILALARPQWGYHERQVITQGVDMMIAIDTSASMMARDYPPSRMARAKDLLRNLIWEAKGNRVGIVAFAGSAAVMCPLTLDYNMASTALKAVDMNTVSARGTNIGAAINSAVGAFEISGANDRVLVLLTDGEQLEQQAALNEAIAKAKEAGVHIFGIGLGSEKGATIPTLRGPLRDNSGQVVDTKLDFELLQRIAKETGGEAIHAGKMGAGEIAQISAELSKFRGQKQQDKTFRVYHERYPLFIAAALVFLVLEALLRGVRRLGRRQKSVSQGAVAVVFAGIILGGTHTIQAYPGETFVRSRDALQKYQQGNYDTAMQEYERATTLDPQNNQLTYNLGATAAKAGRTSEAKTILGKVYDPENELLNIKARYGVATVTHREIRKHISESRDDWATKLAQGDQDARAAVESTIKDLKQVINEYRDVILAQPADLDPKANYEIAKRDLAELEKLLKDNEQKQQQQQQDEQKQDNQEQKEDEQKQGGDQDQQTDEQQQGEGGKDQKEQQQEQQDNKQENKQDQNEQGDQQQDQQNQNEGDKKEDQEGEQKPDKQQGQEGDKPGQEQQPDDQGKPTPTPAPQGSPTPAPSPTPSPTGTPASGTPEGDGQTPGGEGEPVPVGQMSPTDVDRLLNTLPPENQQALQLMMGTPTEKQDMQHEW